MTLIGSNYWWLIIWLAIGGFILVLCVPKKQEIVMARQEIRWHLLAAIALILPFILWAGFRAVDTHGFDTIVYQTSFLKAPNQLSQLPGYLETITKDKGFSVLTVFIKSFIGNSANLYFLILASVQMTGIALVYRKYSCDYLFSIFLFVASTEYIAWMHNGVRQFLSVVLVFVASSLLFKKKYIPLIAVILLASTIHASAIYMLPIVFIVQGRIFNKKTVLCILAVICALLFVSQFTNLLESVLAETQYQDAVSEWNSLGDDGTNPLRAAVYSVPAILALIGWKHMRNETNPVIQVATNASIITAAISWLSVATSGVFLGRLLIWTSLYNGVVLPYEIEHIFEPKSAKIVKIIAVVCYIVFFYYQMHIAWGIM